MKMVFLTYNIAINDVVMEVFKTLGLKTYTRWEEVTGVGIHSGPHLANHIWPAKNSAIAIVLEDEKVKPLMDAVRELRKKIAKEGIKAFVLPVEEVS